MAELTVPNLDFSSLGQLPAVYQKGQSDRLRQQTLSSLGQGGTADAQALLRSGDLSLAQLGMTLQQREAEAKRQAAQDVHQAARDKISDQHWGASYELQKRAANRADEGPVEQAGYRAQVAQKYGIDPNSPEGRSFITTGRLPDTSKGISESAAERTRVLQSQGLDPKSPEGQAFILSGEWTGPGTGGASLNPVYGTVDGKPAMVQTTKTGKAIQTQLPEGFEIAREPIKIDTGTTIKLIDPQTRQLISETPKNPAELERQKTIGDEVAKAQKNYPQVMASGQQILKTISDIENDPALPNSVGSLGSIPSFPGSPGANFNAKAAQLKGQTFLQAYQTLKGGGAITDIEGAKGENALARLDKAQSEKEYRAALKDFRQVIQGGMLRAAAMAKGEIGPPKEDPSFSPTSGPTGPTIQIPPAAIEALRSNPALKADFEAKYGAGTSGVVLR